MNPRSSCTIPRGSVVQLSNDEHADSWPTLAGDGRILSFGCGGYPGSTSSYDDVEIFGARPVSGARRNQRSHESSSGSEP